MDSNLESFFLSNIIYPNDVKRRLNNIRVLDQKIQEKRSQFDELRAKIKTLKAGSSTEEQLLGVLDEVYQSIRALSQEKYDQANSAFLMYENVLRRTDKMIDEVRPEEPAPKEAVVTKIKALTVGVQNIEEEDKQVKGTRSRNKHKKKFNGSQKNEVKQENLFKNDEEFNANVHMGQDEDIACPCGQNKNDDWIGCDMKEKCRYEWFHLGCVNLVELPNDEFWFCDDCKRDFKEEIKQKYKNSKNS